MLCDLHMHSVYSDGSDTPKELIAMARRRGLSVALTDHNTVSGVEEFLLEAQKQGVTAVAGTELSTACGSYELHLLGLFIPREHFDAVERLAKEFHVLKEISNMEMIERLNAAGYDIDYLDVKRRNPNGNANRAHVAAELMEKGYVESITQAFRELLGEDQGFYVPPQRLQLTDAIAFLRSIRAVPVLAHPLQELTPQQLRQLLPQAIQAGLLGMETYHSSYTDETIAQAKQIAEEFGLLQSGGSDYHGTTKPAVKMGSGKGNLAIPVEIYQQLLQTSQTL